MAKKTPQQQAAASATIPGRGSPGRGIPGRANPGKSLLASGSLMRAFFLLVILALSSAEEVFHRRYHEDQSILNPPVHKMIIRNKEQALVSRLPQNKEKLVIKLLTIKKRHGQI